MSAPLQLVLGWADWLNLFAHYLLLSLMSIGGAISTTAEMHRFLVEQHHWLTQAQFNESIAIAQAAPGPNVLFVALVGWNVGLNAGTGTGSTVAARVLSGTGANTGTVAFNLYQTAGATNWGNTQGTDTLSGTGTGNSQTLTVYGVVPAQATPQPDTYKSTITATVYF